MNTSLGYSKKTLTDSNVLLSGGGDKALSEFIGSLNWDSTNKGKTWTQNGASMYFPAAGFRFYNSGSLTNVDKWGYYWSATTNSTIKSRNLFVHDSFWEWSTSMNAFGCPVRPVAEE